MTESGPASDETPSPSLSERIDRVCDEFEAAFRAGRKPSIEAVLATFPEAERSAVLHELVALEIDIARQPGETVPFHGYYRRFPEAARILDELRIELGFHSDDEPAVTSVPEPSDCDRETIVLPKVSHRRIKQFELMSIIGQGGFGTVWRANDTQLQREVAVKVPRPDRVLLLNLSIFLREARAAAKLRHPHIVAVHEVSSDSSMPFIVSELVEGVNLKDRLATAPLGSTEAAILMTKLAGAIQHAHAHRLVHRDLKPANVIIDRNGEPHITDFGLAKQQDSEESLSVEGEIMGTPAYMAPEQARGDHRAIDARTDIYALGAILYELLTGTPPFRGELALLFEQIQHVAPVPPRSLQPKTPKDLEAICLKCLEKDRARRYQTAQALADDLHLYLAGETLRGIPVAIPDRMRKWFHKHRRWLFSVAATFVVAVGIAGALAWHFRPQAVTVPTELRPVEFTTQPPGCEITVVAIDPATGEPDPKRIQSAKGRTPLTMSLAPGDYLVVAVLDQQRFHEVYRRVPSPDDKIALDSRNTHWKLRPSGVIDVAPISIPRPDVTVGMGFVERTDRLVRPESREGAASDVWSLPSFYVDLHEISIDDLKTWRSPALHITEAGPGPFALQTYFRCAGQLEDQGKRFPSAAELYYLSTVVCPNPAPTTGDGASQAPSPCLLPDHSQIEGLHSGVWEWTTTQPGGPFSGFEGTKAVPNQFGSMSLPRMIGCGGTVSTVYGESRKPSRTDFMTEQEHRTGSAGTRGVRSTKPRRTPQDFAAPIDTMPTRSITSELK